ncbi:hypothetical protein ACFSRY_19935 [Pontibacter locisalis]|uniref:Uncharacterized protein n=1 Tax=Pontibacter locisalis TaxID=1719035 RepID=A0ABW5ISV8_9BACT
MYIGSIVYLFWLLLFFLQPDDEEQIQKTQDGPNIYPSVEARYIWLNYNGTVGGETTTLGE